MSQIKPTLRLEGETNITLPLNDKFIESGYSATDNRGVDIRDKVVVTSNLDATKPGEYTVTYTVTDGDGYVTTQTRTITILEEKTPAFTPTKPIVKKTTKAVHQPIILTSIAYNQNLINLISGKSAKTKYLVLLTTKYTLNKYTKSTLLKLKPSKLYIVGSKDLLTVKQVNELKKLLGLSADKIIWLSTKDQMKTVIY
jgi:PKD repeat protein